MLKRITTISIILLVLSVVGTSIYLIANNKKQSLYDTHLAFAYSDDCTKLVNNIDQAETLYQTKVSAGETRLTKLRDVIVKLDSLEKDLNIYISLSSSKKSTAGKLSSAYQSLTNRRKSLIINYNEYIVRMSGNIHIDGNGIKTLYNQIFDKTIEYIYNYNSCFNANQKYVFDKVYKADTIKQELYSLYSASVLDLINSISNHQFKNANLVTSLNNRIKLDSHNNIVVKSSINGGEFSTEAYNLKKHFRLSNMDSLIDTLKATSPSSINPSTETSSEKLTVYYINQILEA